MWYCSFCSSDVRRASSSWPADSRDWHSCSSASLASAGRGGEGAGLTLWISGFSGLYSIGILACRRGAGGDKRRGKAKEPWGSKGFERGESRGGRRAEWAEEKKSQQHVRMKKGEASSLHHCALPSPMCWSNSVCLASASWAAAAPWVRSSSLVHGSGSGCRVWGAGTVADAAPWVRSSSLAIRAAGSRARKGALGSGRQGRDRGSGRTAQGGGGGGTEGIITAPLRCLAQPSTHDTHTPERRLRR